MLMKKTGGANTDRAFVTSGRRICGGTCVFSPHLDRVRLRDYVKRCKPRGGRFSKGRISPMASSQLFPILLVAVVAAIILFRLYSVLGRRTGNERDRSAFDRFSSPQSVPAERTAALPDQTAKQAEGVSSDTDPVARGMLAIKLADRAFESDHFREGARKAYEAIVTAFAHGDRAALRPLLGDDVYSAFDAAIGERARQQHKVEFTFVGLRDAKIVGAALRNNLAEVTVAFGAQFISATVDAQGALVEGDSKAVRDVNDVWTFERNVRTSDPNWRLVTTSGEAGEPKAG